jgi:hypothetical protein
VPHIQQPGLVPVLDSLVVGQIGGRVTDDIGTWMSASKIVIPRRTDVVLLSFWP